MVPGAGRRSIIKIERMRQVSNKKATYSKQKHDGDEGGGGQILGSGVPGKGTAWLEEEVQGHIREQPPKGGLE